MMSKKALLNAKIYRYYSDTFEVTNLLLINGRLAGTGYIPDDEDSDVLDLVGCWIIPDATLILPNGCSNLYLLNDLPFSSLCLPCSSQADINLYTPYTVYPFFNYTSSDETNDHPHQYYGFSGITAHNTDDHDVIFKLAKNSEKPIIVTDESYELDYLLTQQQTHHFSLHVCCSSLRTLEILSSKEKVSFSIDLSLISLEGIKEYVTSPLFMGFCLNSFKYAINTHTLLHTFSELDLCHYFVKNPFTLLKTSPPQLKLNTIPTLIVLDPKSTHPVKQQIADGIIS